MEPEEGNAEARNEIIRSGDSMEKAFLMFVNDTSRIISVYWINFMGAPIHYIYMHPQNSVEINTFRSHAWIFRDGYTGERLQVQRQSVLWAQPFFTRNPRNENIIVPARRRLHIHLPMRTLRENMLWYVVRRMDSHTEQEIHRYDLPKVLKEDLIVTLNKFLEFRATNV